MDTGRFQGKDRSHIVDTVEIRAHLPLTVEQAIAFIRKHDTRAAEIGLVRRTERWGLPPTAVREAVINAVVHADYAQRGAPIRIAIFDDRLEVENPGLLPFGLTIEDLRHGISKLRNRVLGRVFYLLGLIEQRGSRIERMTAACRDAGLDTLRLEEIGTHFRVTLYSARKYKPRVDEIEKAILDAMAGGKGLSTQEIAAEIKRSTRATRTRLLALVTRGLVAEVGTSPQDPTRKYFLVKRG
jgi:ATP-dependent DNA helicase RecG